MEISKWFKKTNGSLSRLWFIHGGIILAALLLIGNLFVIQIVDGKAYSEKANSQYVISNTRMFDRGSIFFTERDGSTIAFATIKTGFILAINPNILKNNTYVYDSISKIIKIDHNSFFIKASKKNDTYEEVARRISKEDKEKIEALNIDGLIFSKERWRYYPAGKTAAQVLGFVGYKGNKLVGRYGLERYYEDVLSRNDSSLYVNFFAEIFANIRKSLFGDDSNKEGDIYTSIEPSVQELLENEIRATEKKFSATGAGGIVIDPNNGTIYAMASIPSFNPNNFSKVKDPSVFKNPLVQDVFEMGSIIKPLTMASGIDAGVVTAKTEYDDKGYVEYNGMIVRNYDGRGRGVIPMQQVLSQSLNTGAAFVMEKLGMKRFRSYFLSLGLGQKTGVDLPEEASGLVDTLHSKRDIAYVTASFGQGIAMTPIETVRALSALGNGGRLITPHVVTKIEYKSGVIKKISYGQGKRVWSKETSNKITKMLINVFDKALLDGAVKLKHYSVATKTGTAQIARGGVGGYYKDKYLHTFFGYFPAYKPRFLIFLYLINPKGEDYASYTLTYPFMDMVKFLINYYNLPPDR